MSRFTSGLPLRVRAFLRVLDSKVDESVQEDGGPGRGNFGHKGRPGLRGGSGKGGGSHYRGANKRVSSQALGKMLSDKYKGRSKAAEIASDYGAQHRLFARSMDGIKYGQKGYDAVSSYNYHGDTLINSMLRGTKPRSFKQQKEWQENKDRTKQYIADMTEAMKANKLRQDAIVYRGIETFSGLQQTLGLNVDAKQMQEMLNNPDFVDSMVGYTFRDKAFVSTTIDKDVIYKGRFAKACEMEIHCPAGTEGVYQGDQFRITDEAEFTMQRGTQFVVTGASVVENQFGVKRLKLDVTVLSQQPDADIPETQKAYRDPNPEIVQASVEKRALPTSTLEKTYSGASSDFLKEFNELQKTPDSIDKHDMADTMLETQVALGKINPVEAAELMGYCRGYDMTDRVDDYEQYLEEVKKSKAEYSKPEYADKRAKLQRENPGLSDDDASFLIDIDNTIAATQESVKRSEERDGPDDFFVKKKKNRVKLLQMQRKDYIAEAVRR